MVFEVAEKPNSSRELAAVIPAYNASKTVARAVTSALEAGALAYVVDDGSTDGTADVASKAGAVVIRQENSGASVARQRGINATEQEFVVFLDADDALLPEGVQRSVDYLNKNANIVVSAGTVIGVGSSGRKRQFPVRYTPVTTESLLRNGYGPWPPAAAVVRVSSYRESEGVLPAPLKPPYAEDYELLLRLSLVGEIDVRDDPTCVYQLDGGKSARSSQKALECKEQIRQYYSNHCGIEIDLMSSVDLERAALARSARGSFAAGDWRTTVRTMVRWVSIDPISSLRTISSRPWRRN